MVRLRRRFLPRARRGDLQRSVQGGVRAADGLASGSTRSRTRRSTSCRATRPGRSAARTTSASSSPASPTMTARGSSIPKSRNLTSALELDGSKVCMQKGTTSEPNAADFFETNHINYQLVEADTVGDVVADYLGGKCDVLSTDYFATLRLALAVSQARRSHDPARRHLQGAARPGGAAGRHAVVQYRQVGQFRASRRRGARRRLEDDRRRAEVAEACGEAPRRRRKATSASRSASPTPGRRTRSARSATTAKCSTAMSASRRNSASRAA